MKCSWNIQYQDITTTLTSVVSDYSISSVKFNPSFAEHDMHCLSKQRRANRSGSALFVIKYVNFYQKPESSNLIGWKLEVIYLAGQVVKMYYGKLWAPMWENVASDMCPQRRLISAGTFAQSDQSSLSAWRNFAFLAIQNGLNDFDQTMRMHRLNLRWRTCLKVRFWRCG